MFGIRPTESEIPNRSRAFPSAAGALRVHTYAMSWSSCVVSRRRPRLVSERVMTTPAAGARYPAGAETPANTGSAGRYRCGMLARCFVPFTFLYCNISFFFLVRIQDTYAKHNRAWHLIQRWRNLASGLSQTAWRGGADRSPSSFISHTTELTCTTLPCYSLLLVPAELCSASLLSLSCTYTGFCCVSLCRQYRPSFRSRQRSKSS